MWRNRTRVALFLFLLACATEFVIRGPVRFLRQSSDWNDLVPVYLPARAWVHAANPYDANVYSALWTQTFARQWSPAAPRSHPVYPLSAFVLLSPIASLRWSVSQRVWACLEVLLVAAAIFSLTRFGDLRGNASLVFTAAVLALAPLHTGLATGNISVAAIALACIGACAVAEGKNILAGVLLGIALGLKPQITLFFLLYYVLRKNWITCSSATGVVGGTWLLGILRLHALGAPWLADFVRNTRVFVGSNPYDDFTLRNPIRFTLIDLQVPFYDFTGAKMTAVVLALTTVAALALVFLYFFIRSDNPDDLLNLSILGTLSLLPFYHRFYDAFLLAMPIAWSLRANGLCNLKLKRASWLLFLPFFFPGASLLERAASEGRVPENVVQSWTWKHLLMPHEIWVLVLLVILLLAAMKIRRTGALSGSIPAKIKEQNAIHVT